jgi:GMP synthase (glutamine-hydrolysing)
MQRHATVLIIDFGSQVTELIARRVREFGCYSEVHPCTISDEKLAQIAPKAIILSGGPAGVSDHGAPTVTAKIFEMGVPILGICYGQQLMCHMLGGQVEPSTTREYGRAALAISQDSPLFKDVWAQGKSYEVSMISIVG